MNAKEYDMMIFIGAGQGFPGSLSDHEPPGIPGSRAKLGWWNIWTIPENQGH